MVYLFAFLILALSGVLLLSLYFYSPNVTMLLILSLTALCCFWHKTQTLQDGIWVISGLSLNYFLTLISGHIAHILFTLKSHWKSCHSRTRNASSQLLIFAYSIPFAHSSVTIIKFIKKFPIILLCKVLLDWNRMISFFPDHKYESRDWIFFIFVFLPVNLC